MANLDKTGAEVAEAEGELGLENARGTGDVDEAIAVSRRAPAGPAQEEVDIAPSRTRLAGGPAFQVERLKGPGRSRLSPPSKGLWLVLLEGAADLGDRRLNPGEVWWLDEDCSLRLAAAADLILAYPGGKVGSFISPTA